MSLDSPDPQMIRDNIGRAKQRRDAALAELDAATRELQWWRDGLAMFDPEAAAVEAIEERADARINEIIPEGFGTLNPSVRQVILFALRADPYGDWPIDRIRDVAEMHGWSNPDSADLSKRITDMVSVMADDDLLERVDRGVYRLPKPLADALSRALHPITDYRRAARSRFPAPGRTPLAKQRLRRVASNTSDIHTSQAGE